MFVKDGKKLCSLCFSIVDTKTHKCPNCNGQSNTEKYPGALPEGTILSGKYYVGKVLGKGGFGITYLCYNLNANKQVAIKEFLPDSIAHRNSGETIVHTVDENSAEFFKEGSSKFYDEARLVSRFNGNPNIISVYEFFYENNTTYFVMEYLEGCDFKKYIFSKGGSIPESEALYIIDRIAEALVIVHSTGILHRDVSPDNIYLCSNGDIKLIDFGAARQVMGEVSKSLSTILKPGFAPFEQYKKNGNQGPWTDMYALGATLYYAVKGVVIDDAMTRLDDDDSLNLEGVSPLVAAIITKMLSIRIEDRFSSAVEFRTAIRAAGVTLTPPEIDAAKPKNSYCVCCGKEIPNGYTVCNDCQKKIEGRKNFFARLQTAINSFKQKIAKVVSGGSTGAFKKTAVVGVAVIAGLILIGILPDWQDKADEAQTLLDEGNYDEAIEAYNEIEGDWDEKIREANYRKAMDLMDEGEYNQASTYFQALADAGYLDSAEKLKECQYQRGSYCMVGEKYEDAIAVFELLGDYKDSKAKLLEAKYQYVIANKTHGNKTTYKYLKELKNQFYKDSASIFENLYAWNFYITVNDDKENSTLDYTSVSRYKPWYVHVSLSGGEPGEQIYLQYSAQFPNGDVLKGKWDNAWEDDFTGWSEWYYTNPQYGATGTFMFKLYDSEYNLLAERTVRVD